VRKAIAQKNTKKKIYKKGSTLDHLYLWGFQFWGL